MCGRDRLAPVNSEWISRTAQKMRDDASVALCISTLIPKISGAVHNAVRDSNGNIEAGDEYTNIEQLIQKHLSEPIQEGHMKVQSRILHYQRGGLTPFCTIYRETFPPPDYTGTISYEREHANLVYGEFMIQTGEMGINSSEAYEGLSIPGYYIALRPILQRYLFDVLGRKNIDIEALSLDHRVIVTQDCSTNRSVHVYNEADESICSLAFGPKRIYN